MKVLFCTYRFYPDLGGIEVNSEILATEFHRAGHDVKLVTLTEEKGERAFPFEVVRRPSLRSLFALHRWADTVYQNNISLRLLWPAWILRKPVTISVRTWIRRDSGRMGVVDFVKMLSLWPASRISISKAVADSLWFSSTVIGNPYRDDLFYVMPDVERDRDLCYLGRLVSDKGVDLLIEAVAHLKLQGKVVTATVIGNGPEELTLRQLAKDRGVEEQIIFSDPLHGESLRIALNRHRMLVVPSRWAEPFGNVALEGAACGCWVVASNQGGLPDAVGPCGALFENGSLASLLATLEPGNFNKDSKKCFHHLLDRRKSQVAKLYLRVLHHSLNLTPPPE